MYTFRIVAFLSKLISDVNIINYKCLGLKVGRPGFISHVESYQKTLKSGIHNFPAWCSV